MSADIIEQIQHNILVVLSAEPQSKHRLDYVGAGLRKINSPNIVNGLEDSINELVNQGKVNRYTNDEYDKNLCRVVTTVYLKISSRGINNLSASKAA